MLREYLHGEKASRVGVLMDGKTDSVFTNDIRAGERESTGCRGIARGLVFDL